jgi:hypothetical protein
MIWILAFVLWNVLGPIPLCVMGNTHLGDFADHLTPKQCKVLVVFLLIVTGPAFFWWTWVKIRRDSKKVHP